SPRPPRSPSTWNGPASTSPTNSSSDTAWTTPRSTATSRSSVRSPPTSTAAEPRGPAGRTVIGNPGGLRGVGACVDANVGRPPQLRGTMLGYRPKNSLYQTHYGRRDGAAPLRMDGREAILPWAGHVDRAGRPCRGRVDAGRRLVGRLQDGGHGPGRPGDQREQGRAGQADDGRRADHQGRAQGRRQDQGQLEDPGELHR